MRNFKASAGIILLLASFSINAEICGGADENLDCCSEVSSNDDVTCAIPANNKYEFTLKRFGFEKTNGDIVWVGSQTTFDAANANIGNAMGNFVTSAALPNGTYVAVRPELNFSFLVSGDGISTSDNKACTSGGDQIGDLAKIMAAEGDPLPSCDDEPNAFECNIGNGFMRIRDDSMGNFTIGDGSEVTLTFKFDVGSSVLFEATGGACVFKSIGMLDASLTLN
ncbi:hypothetical protein ACYVVD_06235 [Arenicellales bacterium IMCC58067]